MKKLIVLSLSSVLLAVLLATPALASSPVLAEGWDEFVAGSWDSRTTLDRGRNCIIEITNATRNFYGTLDGTAEEDVRVVVGGPCEGVYPGKYRDVGHAAGTFVGYVGDRYGTFRYVYNFRTYPTDPPSPGGTGTGKLTILNGTGELANLHGVLETSWPPDYYTGSIHFDPQP